MIGGRPTKGFLLDVVASPHTPSQILARSLLFGLTYVIAGELSLMSRLPETQLSLIWPSSGVAAFWLLTSSRQSLNFDFLGLAAAATITVALASPVDAMLIFRSISAILMALVFRAMVDRCTPLRRQDGTLRQVTLPVTVARLAGISIVAGALQSGVTELGLWLVSEPSWVSFVQRTGRNATAIFSISTLGLLFLGLARPRNDVHDELIDEKQSDPVTAVRPDTSPRWLDGRVVESFSLVVFTVLVFAVVFGFVPELPMSFALFLPSVWAGIRYSPPFAALHGLAVGVAAVGLTLSDIGMYARIVDPTVEAFVAQAFLATVFGTTLMMSVIRTQWQTSEQRSRGRSQLLVGVLRAVEDGILLVDEDERILLRNPASAQLAWVGEGTSRIGLVAPDTWFDSHGRAITAETLPHRRALAGHTVTREDMHFREPGGADRVMRVDTQLLHTGHSRRQVLVTFHDVTAERAHSASLASFAGEVAHDLKNPLAVIEGWGEMLATEFSEVEQLDSSTGLSMTRRIQGAAAHMRTLITELLSYTLARDHELHPTGLDFAALTEGVAGIHRSTASAQAGSLPEVVIESQDYVWADPVLTRQLMDNLIGNAVKYVAPQVRPHVLVQTQRTPDGVVVTVTDNGLGVPEAERERIFDSFYRMDRPGYSGTGLGLAICHRIAERHGSSLRVTDGPDGVGSTFTFRLPAPARIEAI